MKEALHRAWRPRNTRVRRVDVETLAYTPEARVALRFDVLAESKDTGIPELRRLCGKLDGRREPTRLFTGHWAVWRRASSLVSIAPPVGYIAVSRISLQEFVRGERLTDLAGKTTFQARVRDAAHAIATVNSLALPLPARRSVDKEMAGVDRWIGVLARLCPGQSARLRSLRTRLHTELADRMRVTGTVHADFHFANVLANERNVTIIDWDQVAHGDPMIDVGRALASLRVSALRVHGRIDGLADVEDAFLETYLRRSQEDERRARLFEAVSLLIAASSPFRLQREGWQESAVAMIDEVERTLGLSRAGPRIAFTSPGKRFVIPFEERTGWALDRAYAQAALVPLVHRRSGADIEVTECHPTLVSQQEDQIHLRWKLKGYRGEVRWRGDLEGVGFPNDSGRGRLRRLTELRKALDSNPNALQVPDPIGHVGPLSLVVFTSVPGRWLDVSRPDEEFARFGRALALLHALQIDLDKERETARDIRAVALQIRRLARARHPAAVMAEDGYRRIEPTVRAVGERRAPTILGIQPNHLRLEDDRASVALVRDTLLAEPLLVAGELAARLRERALREGRVPTGADAFGRAYVEASGQSSGDFLAFETLSLVLIACRRAAANRRDPLPEALLRNLG
ncbi:MAG: phosphotransferase family protein [Planctomycetota bacterium]